MQRGPAGEAGGGLAASTDGAGAAQDGAGPAMGQRWGGDRRAPGGAAWAPALEDPPHISPPERRLPAHGARVSHKAKPPSVGVVWTWEMVNICSGTWWTLPALVGGPPMPFRECSPCAGQAQGRGREGYKQKKPMPRLTSLRRNHSDRQNIPSPVAGEGGPHSGSDEISRRPVLIDC